jgi:hypothetical protein
MPDYPDHRKVPVANSRVGYRYSQSFYRIRRLRHEYAPLGYTWDSPLKWGDPKLERPKRSRDDDLEQSTLRSKSEVTLDRLKLSQDNLEQFKQPEYLCFLGFKRLPTVIRDAMSLVLRSSVRYL